VSNTHEEKKSRRPRASTVINVITKSSRPRASTVINVITKSSRPRASTFINVGWLVVQQHINTERSTICASCGAGKPAQSAKDGQRDTMHITLRYKITM